jgi:hypothetical protein
VGGAEVGEGDAVKVTRIICHSDKCRFREFRPTEFDIHRRSYQIATLILAKCEADLIRKNFIEVSAITAGQCHFGGGDQPAPVRNVVNSRHCPGGD